MRPHGVTAAFTGARTWAESETSARAGRASPPAAPGLPRRSRARRLVDVDDQDLARLRPRTVARRPADARAAAGDETDLFENRMGPPCTKLDRPRRPLLRIGQPLPC